VKAGLEPLQAGATALALDNKGDGAIEAKREARTIETFSRTSFLVVISNSQSLSQHSDEDSLYSSANKGFSGASNYNTFLMHLHWDDYKGDHTNKVLNGHKQSTVTKELFGDLPTARQWCFFGSHLKLYRIHV
jgi:hypothetical protein